VVRRRLGELGLTFTVVTVPRRREDRVEVHRVSGQYLVPTLVIEEEGKRTVLTDENEILRYLDERYAPREAPAAGTLPPELPRLLRAAYEGARRHGEELRRLAGLARSQGNTDLANVLTVASENLLEASGWLSYHLDESP
jgi:glutathione S-transferase